MSPLPCAAKERCSEPTAMCINKTIQILNSRVAAGHAVLDPVASPSTPPQDPSASAAALRPAANKPWRAAPLLLPQLLRVPLVQPSSWCRGCLRLAQRLQTWRATLVMLWAGSLPRRRCLSPSKGLRISKQL